MNAVSWWRWIALPWRQPSVAFALIGALALPALLLSSGPMFRTAASDEITVQVVGALEPGPAGLVVQGHGPLDADRLGAFATAVEARLGAIDRLGPAGRTLFTDAVALSTVDGVAVEAPAGPGDIRVLARPGAGDAVELVAGERTGGALVPASLAERYGLAPGARLGLGAGELAVAGVYRDLWQDGRDPYWEAVPTELVPRFLRVFQEPEFELVIAPDADLRRLEILGRGRWEAPLDRPPSTWSDLQALEAQYRAAERALAREGPLNDAYRGWADDPEQPAFVFTALSPAVDRAAALVREIEQPVRTATWGGTVAGVLLSTLGALFLIRRRRSDYRLMAADGDAAWRFFGRALAQYSVPAVVATVVGVALGWVVVRVLGPSGTATFSAVAWGEVLAVTVIAALLAGAVSAATAVRLTDAMEQPIGELGRAWVLVLLGVAATMWVQVGRERTGEVNPLIVAFPLVGVVTGVVVIVALLRLVLRRFRRAGRSLPTSLFLAWRALAASETGALLLTAALGLASGLVVLSVSFVGTIDAAVEAKAATVAGAVSRLDTRDNVDPSELPPGSTLVLSSTTRIGELGVEVLAIDPATFPDAVAWPEEFGDGPDRLVELLGSDTPGALPAVAVVGGGVPASGEFGVQRFTPYELVGTVRSVPMASLTIATLIVRADVFERFAAERFARGLGIDPVDVLVADTLDQELQYESPLSGYRDTVLSAQPLPDLEAFAAEQAWRVTATATLDGQAGDVGAQSTRWAFDYLGLLAAVAGVVALAVMAFYLAERRRQREVTAAMTDQMGIPHRTRVVAAVTEMVGLVAAAIAAGALAAAVTARRVFPTFEPDRSTPPTVGLVVDVTTIVAVFAVAVVAVAVITAWSERSVSRARKAAVLRG